MQGVQGPVGADNIIDAQYPLTYDPVTRVLGIEPVPNLVAYVYTQSVPSDTWVITHNLNFYPNVTIIDSAGTICVGDVTYTDRNSLTLTFGGGFSGEAYLS